MKYHWHISEPLSLDWPVEECPNDRQNHNTLLCSCQTVVLTVCCTCLTFRTTESSNERSVCWALAPHCRRASPIVVFTSKVTTCRGGRCLRNSPSVFSGQQRLSESKACGNAPFRKSFTLSVPLWIATKLRFSFGIISCAAFLLQDISYFDRWIWTVKIDNIVHVSHHFNPMHAMFSNQAVVANYLHVIFALILLVWLSHADVLNAAFHGHSFVPLEARGSSQCVFPVPRSKHLLSLHFCILQKLGLLGSCKYSKYTSSYLGNQRSHLLVEILPAQPENPLSLLEQESHCSLLETVEKFS